MSDCMFGQRFFAARERLFALIQSIRKLAADTKADTQEHLSVAHLNQDLLSPFKFVVCGEINAGKSSLLNALCGHELCPTGFLPVTDGVQHYRYGQPKSDFTSDGVAQKFRPLGFLKDIELIDTPGTNSPDGQNLVRIAQEADRADLLLCVFPVTNPWGAATWDFLTGLSRENLARTVLIIQQSDQREPCDLTVILGHMADLSMKRLGVNLPVFALSAKLACEACLSSSRAEKLWHKSGFPALLDYFSHSICLSPSRFALLETWRLHAAKALRLIEDHIDQQDREIKNHGRFIDGVESEIDQVRLEFVARLPHHLSKVAQVFQTEAAVVSTLLHRRLRAFPSFFRLFTSQRCGQQIETEFTQRLQQTIKTVADTDASAVAESCEQHWQELGRRIEEKMRTALKSEKPIDEILVIARQRFVARLSGAASESISSLRVRALLDKELRRRDMALRSFLVMALVLTTIGASCGALEIPWIPWILCSFAGLFFIGGVVVAWLTRRSLTRDFRKRLLDTCDAFASDLQSDYEDGLRVLFQDYTASLRYLRTHLAREQLAIEPRLRRWQELFLTLKTIEQDLHP